MKILQMNQSNKNTVEGKEKWKDILKEGKRQAKEKSKRKRMNTTYKMFEIPLSEKSIQMFRILKREKQKQKVYSVKFTPIWRKI